MKILIALTYYKPYISGLTIYAARIAEAWAAMGHQVTVLTSRHLPELPAEERINGVRIIREPVLMKISKGSVMPKFWKDAASFVKAADVVNIHLPQLESALLARLGKRYHKRVILTYHCDLQMPTGIINKIANKGVLWMNDLAARACDIIVTNSQDYADHSDFLQKYREKVHIVPPPVVLEATSGADLSDFREKKNAGAYSQIIGMACRFAADKGVEILLDALPEVLAEFPDAGVFFMGPYENVLGEEAYYERLKPRIDELIAAEHWQFMGKLPDHEVGSFYRCIDVLVMPSLNRTDSFGLVQIEAMISGKPVIASDLPGIRVPVTQHRQGAIFPVGSSHELAQAIIRLLSEEHEVPEDVRDSIRELYSPENAAAAYAAYFENPGAM